jgi:hypothetical protein
MKTSFELWQDGEITDQQIFRELAVDLGEVTSELEPLQKEEKLLRERLGIVVDRMGGKAELKGFGRVLLTSASKSVSFDTDKLHDLVKRYERPYTEIVFDDSQDAFYIPGYYDGFEAGVALMIEEILLCQKETHRSGSLRIEREKAKKI